MATSTVPQGASAPIRRKAAPKTSVPTGVLHGAHHVEAVAPQAAIPPWRIAVEDSLTELRGLLDAASSLDISFGNNAFVTDLIDIVDDLLETGDHLRRTGSADDYYNECIRKVHSVLAGAKEIVDLSDGMRAILRTAHDTVAGVAKILDEAALVNTDAFEARANALLDSLDMYLAGLENVGLGEKAYDEYMAIDAPHHYWETREALEKHDSKNRIVAELCAMREGMERTAASIAPNPGVPLMQECASLITKFLSEEDSRNADLAQG